MSIASVLTRLAAAKTAISNAITAKGGTVAQGDGFEDFATDIATIPAGSSAVLVSKTITENGTYDPTDDNADGYSSVEVDTFDEAGRYFNKTLRSIRFPTWGFQLVENQFKDFTQLKKVVFMNPTFVTSISNYMFKGCTALTDVVMPSGTNLTSVGWNMFEGCTALKNVTFSTSLTSVPACCFLGCSSLLMSTVPSNVATIHLQAFAGCTSITTFTCPSSITSIRQEAFKDCSNLLEMHLQGSTPPTLQNVNAFPTSNTGFKIYVPQGSLSAYSTETNWSNLYNDGYLEEEAVSE